MRAGIAASGIRPVPPPEWFGAAETPPEGSAALVIVVHYGSLAYPTDISVGGSAAELLSLGISEGGTVVRRVSMWWCADPGPSGVLAGAINDAYRWTQVLYCSGLEPGEIMQDYDGNYNATAKPHAPSLVAGGVAVSMLSHRGDGGAPVANHEFFDTESRADGNVSRVTARWTAGTDLPTDWVGHRYHAQMTVALNPIGA